MRFSDLRYDKGVAGLTILLGLITMLFVIGLLVMIFSLMGSEMREATYDAGSGNTEQEAGHVNETGYTVSNVSLGLVGFSLNTVVIYNATYTLATGNYTFTSAGVIINTTTPVGWENDYLWSINYTYTFDQTTTATDVMNDTTSGIANVTDWYPIFIVIGAMVVLILLVVIIITAIRSSGLIAGGTVTGRSNIGSA